jgi:hypothetical protein
MCSRRSRLAPSPRPGRLGAPFVRPTVFRGATAGVDFLAGLVWAARFRPGLAAAHRLFVAALIRARPSGVRRRFVLAVFAGAGVAAAFGFPGSPPLPLCGGHAPARGGACDALGSFAESERDRPFEARGPVMRTRTPPRKGPRRSRLRTGCARRWPAAATAESMRSRRAAERRQRVRHLGGPAPHPPRGRPPFPPPSSGLATFRSGPAGVDFLAALLWAARFTPGLAVAGVAFSGAPDFPAALAFLSAAHRLLRRRDAARPSRGDSGGASSWRHSQAPAPLPPCPSPQTPSVSSALPSSGGRCTLADYHLRRGDRRPPCCSAEPRRIHGGGEARGTRWKRERLSAPDRPLGHRPP